MKLPATAEPGYEFKSPVNAGNAVASKTGNGNTSVKITPLASPDGISIDSWN